MRGTREGHRHLQGRTGIIPAYAGNTLSICSRLISPGDHPRVCGEHGNIELIEIVHLGSSPRMRGTRTGLGLACRPCGIIPAYAGNTVTLSAMHEAYWDHPRVCGEHIRLTHGKNVFRGSSPRMRGTRLPVRLQERWSGIIPAYAGNTQCDFHFPSLIGDHPRVCGEHLRDMRGGH